jgi:hypothetical protein
MANTFKLDGLKKKTASASGKKDYPVLPDPNGDIAKSVAILCDCKAKLDQLQGTYDIHEGELKAKAREFLFSRTDSPGTVKAHATNGASVSVSAQNRYYGIPSTADGDGGEVENPRIAALRKVMGERFDGVFNKEFTITIDSSKIPPANVQEFIESLVGIANMYDCGEAIVAKEFFKPKESFHIDRCALFTEEQNHEINRHMPMTIMLRAKGVQ